MTAARYVVTAGLMGALVGCNQRPDSPRIEKLENPPKPDSAIAAAGSVDRLPSDPSRDSISLVEADSGRMIDVARGRTVVVRLNSNPSTGYRWTLIPASGGVLTQIGESVYTPASEPAGAVGSGGFEVWSFLAAQSGRQELRFEYRRPWESGAPAARTLRYTVAVP